MYSLIQCRCIAREIIRAAALDKNPVKATASEVIKDLRTHPAHRYDMQALHIVLDYLDLVKRL
jgi:hypothetical protein